MNYRINSLQYLQTHLKNSGQADVKDSILAQYQ